MPFQDIFLMSNIFAIFSVFMMNIILSLTLAKPVFYKFASVII